MANRLKLLSGVKNVLTERFFTEEQIEKILPRLGKEFFHQPKYLGEIIDTWNIIMNNAVPETIVKDERYSHIPPMAVAPKTSLLGEVYGDISTPTVITNEPDLLLLDPEKLINRHARILGLGITKNKGQEWVLLFNAARGFFLQDWYELMRKIFYIEQNVINFLFDKKEQKTMEVHPLIKSAASVEMDFDHIRTRYLFASRSGYRSLAHLYSVQTALDKPSLGNLLLVSDREFLEKFTPYCSEEEYSSFSNLVKNTELESEDHELCEKFAELECLKS